MQVEQKGVGKRIEAALHFRQTLSEKLPSARSKCIFCIFVIGHVFFGEMWSSFCQRSSQLVFASCMLVVCIFFGGVVSPFLLSLWFLWINWFRRKSDEMRHLLLPVLWLCFASHETVFWRPQLIKFCSSALLRLIWNGRLAGLVKNLENISISGAPKRLYKILKWDGWSIDCMQIYEMHNQNAYLLSIWVNCKNLQPNFWRAGHLLNYTIQSFTERRGPKNRHWSLSPVMRRTWLGLV